MTVIKQGMKVECLNASGYNDLTKGKTYVAVADEEEGIFSGIHYSYIRVIGDFGEETAAYARRFKPLSKDKQ